MTRVLIIEDEEAAAKRLQKMVSDALPESVVADSLRSIASATEWFNSNPQPDLAFFDIHLADGNSFEIFKRVKVDCPVIFTTAYDQYALEAFKVNSIDYLLKPVKKDELERAIEKFRHLHFKAPAPVDIQKLLASIQKVEYKERFIIRYGEHMKTIQTADIAYFYTENRVSFAALKEGKRYAVDHNMDQLEEMLNPRQFFRINRQFIIGYDSITEMLSYSKSRVLVKLNPPTKEDTIVSSERSAAFKAWLAGE
ncbi:MAG: response regulator transcription factor [Chitinophagaceae bacterium]|jgi:two-component system LytT family response regulator|nr:response regulator transcription factor [Chitinophagaceae bacterium]